MHVSTDSSLPQLPPELWNFIVIIVICGILGWTFRVINLALMYMEAYCAIQSNAVLYLKNLGPSISVLENASMWHLQHLLRTKIEPFSAKMKRVEVPFDIISSSLQVTQMSSGNKRALTFAFRTKTPCTVQIMWDVKRDALEHSQRNGESSDDVTESNLPRLFERISIRRILGFLSTIFSHTRRQNRRHELRDEVAPAPEHCLPFSPGGRFHEDDFTAQSDLQRFDCDEMCKFSAPIPTELSEIHQTIHSAEDPDNTSPVVVPTTALVRPRYSAVIIVRKIPLSTSSPRSSEPTGTIMGKIRIGRRRSSSNMTLPTIMSQYIAIDLLPTPSKQDNFMPSIIKTVNCTKSQAFVTQDVYGNIQATTSECAICLEGTVSVILLPCRHFCVCQVCLEEIDRCPICRTKFMSYCVHTQINPST